MGRNAALPVGMIFFLILSCMAGLSAESMLRDEAGYLRLLEYDGLQFAAGTTPSGEGRTSVSVNGDVFCQSVFDSLCRIIERTEWKNTRSSKDSTLLCRRTYRYRSADDAKDVIPVQLTETRFDEPSVTETFFDASGNSIKVLEYSTEKKRTLLRKTERTYDGQNRLSVERITSTDRKVPAKKTVFTYTGKSSCPDSSYYEGNVLRIATTYRQEASCETKTYFDRGLVTSVLYEDGRRVLEVVTVNGVEKSRRTFDVE